jgi:simple sugar transport system ATP-binding protein
VVFRVNNDLADQGECILDVRDLHVSNDFRREALQGLTFKLHKSEILGIAGVAGNGQKELFEALIGIRKIDRGEIFYQGRDISNLNPSQVMKKGIGHVPEDRVRMGLIPDFSVAENLILGRQRRPPIRKGLIIDENYVKSFAKECVKDFDISTPSIYQKTQYLSGGNQQKVILARELNQQPKVFITNQPTRGLDVGVIEYVHRQLLEKRKEGVAILLFSEDLDEILNLSDRIIVLFKGQIMGDFSSSSVRVEELGLLMAGVKEEEK